MSQRTLLFAVVLSGFLLGGARSAEAHAAPICDGRFHFIDVPGSRCMDGSQTGLQYACLTGSAASPLLVNVDGGGACWDGDSCDCQPDPNGLCTNPASTIEMSFFHKPGSFDGLAWEDTALGQPGMFAGPNSPFNRDWNVVFVPYCTADAHTGDAVNTYVTSDGRSIVAHNHGYRNMSLMLNEIKSLFPRPDRVVVYGSSAGGIGIDCNLTQFRQHWPDTRMHQLNNAGMPFEGRYAPLLPDVLHSWGAWHPGSDGTPVADTCPIEVPAGATTSDISAFARFNRLHHPDVRKAFTDDYSDAMIQFFACLLGAKVDPNGTCDQAVRRTLDDVLDNVITTTDPSYRVFYHRGDCHGERDSDDPSIEAGCTYDGMVSHGVHFSDWVNAWIDDRADWGNVR